MKLYFFQFHSPSTFWFVRFVSHYFNKLEKNKILISYFPAHFPWYNQILESVFQLIFHYTTKHQKIIHFSGIHFPKENYFPANKRDLKKYKKGRRFVVYNLSSPRISYNCLVFKFLFLVSRVFYFFLFGNLAFLLFNLIILHFFFIFSLIWNIYDSNFDGSHLTY